MKIKKNNIVHGLNNSPFVFGKKPRQGRIVKYVNRHGHLAKLQLHKSIPRHCSVPRQVCIKCLVSVIHKNDSNYQKKICKPCEKL